MTHFLPPFAPLLPFFFAALLLPTSTLSHYVLSFTNARQIYALSFACQESPSNGTNRWVSHQFGLAPDGGYREFTLPRYVHEHEQPEESGESEASSSTRGDGNNRVLKRKRRRADEAEESSGSSSSDSSSSETSSSTDGEKTKSRRSKNRKIHQTSSGDDEDERSSSSSSSSSDASSDASEETEEEESKKASSSKDKSHEHQSTSASSKLLVNRQQEDFLPTGFKVNCNITTVPPSPPCSIRVFDPYGNPYPEGQEEEKVWARFDWELRQLKTRKQFYLKDPDGNPHKVFTWVVKTEWPSTHNNPGWKYRKVTNTNTNTDSKLKKKRV